MAQLHLIIASAMVKRERFEFFALSSKESSQTEDDSSDIEDYTEKASSGFTNFPNDRIKSSQITERNRKTIIVETI
ncbi:MAG: hypothetical protein AUK63_1449 [bacterium P3]|nr:MAG: hypothetical protein AUK63_1449 [bacterium P3]KWW40058.1 MAG: hypothetical protein F083_1780 [bacterium F083]